MNTIGVSAIKKKGGSLNQKKTSLTSNTEGLVKTETKVKRSTDSRDRMIGHQIRTRRVILGISQQELSEMLGISFQQLQKYEKGANRTTSTRLIDIAKSLKCSVNLFLSPAIGDDDLDDSVATFNDKEQAGGSDLADEDVLKYRKNGPRNRELLELNRYFSLITSKVTRRHFLNLVRSLATQNEEQGNNPEGKESIYL